ncbi:MAG: cupin domain-containing protein [Candidatus Promineifilaceae bacterium]
MESFDLETLLAAHDENGRPYYEFLRVPALSVGLYRLPADGQDPQSPHNEDEVYYIISGEGKIHVEGEDRPVKAGTTVYVAAHDVHYFHSITDALTILVFFAPAET